MKEEKRMNLNENPRNELQEGETAHSNEKDVGKLLEEKYKSKDQHFCWDFHKKTVLAASRLEKMMIENNEGENIFIRIVLFQKIKEEIIEKGEMKILMKSESSNLGIHFGTKLIYFDKG